MAESEAGQCGGQAEVEMLARMLHAWQVHGSPTCEGSTCRSFDATTRVIYLDRATRLIAMSGSTHLAVKVCRLVRSIDPLLLVDFIEAL